MLYTAVLAGWMDQLLLMMDGREKHKQNHLVQRVTQHINTHLADDLSASALSAIFYMSATGLRRVFKETTGMTLKEYSLQTRMNHAIVLLGQHVPVQEVSAAVGYASPQAFINAFKQATGVSPTQYHRNKSS